MGYYDDIIGRSAYGLAIGAEDGGGCPGAGPMLVGPNGPLNPGQYDPSLVAAQIMARESFLVGPRAGGVARLEPLGLGETCVDPGECITIVVQPQVLFKPKKFVVDSSIAYQFQIEQMKFGKWNFFANGGSVPASIFTETATDNIFNGDTIQPSGNFSISVKNRGSAQAVFVGAVWGLALE